MSSRLSRGRQLLRSRLERRGLDVAPAMLAANWLAGTPAAPASPLLESTVAAAVGSASAKAVSALVLSLTHGVLRIMWLRKLGTIALAVLLLGGTTGSLGVWAHWPSAEGKTTSAPRHGAAPTPDGSVAPARDARSDQQPGQPPARTATAGEDARLADCPADCPGSDDCPPPYCPISLASNAFAKVVGYFHSSSGSPR